MERLSKLEILNETIAFYNADVNRRSKLKSDECVYNGKNGANCAVGRCMLSEFIEQGDSLLGNYLGLSTLYSLNKKASLDEMLQEQYRGHDIEFWYKLQRLHDIDRYWDNAGLTAEGEVYTSEICNLFKLVN